MDIKTSRSVKLTIGYRYSRKRNIPKIVSYFFIISQFFTGFDFGFTKSFGKKIHRFTRMFTILEVCSYSGFIFAHFVIYNIPFYNSSILLTLTEYLLNVIVLLCHKKYNIYDFLCNISEFFELTRSERYTLNFVSVTQCVIFFSLNIMFLIMMLEYDLGVYIVHFSPFYFCLTVSHCILIDLVAVAQIVIFYYVYCSMKHLKLMLTSFNQKLNFISKLYKDIVDTCEKIKPLSDTLVSEQNINVKS